jgi:hypothetical protein
MIGLQRAVGGRARHERQRGVPRVQRIVRLGREQPLTGEREPAKIVGRRLRDRLLFLLQLEVVFAISAAFKWRSSVFL